jgi:hypothetical protein
VLKNQYLIMPIAPMPQSLKKGLNCISVKDYIKVPSSRHCYHYAIMKEVSMRMTTLLVHPKPTQAKGSLMVKQTTNTTRQQRHSRFK